MLRIEDLVEISGVEAIVTTILPDSTVICQPVGRGLPLHVTSDKVLVKYSFLSELEKLATSEELQNILKTTEELLERMNQDKKTPRQKIVEKIPVVETEAF